MKNDMDFPGKILLFGEYGVLLNSMALAVPFTRYTGRLGFAGTPGNPDRNGQTTSKAELEKLFSFLRSRSEKFGFLDLEQMEDDLQKGLYFDSNIPQGAGLGSSGALTAALYSRYAVNQASEASAETREHLAAMESCFHGQSSGIDPLTSWLKKPVLLENPTSTCATDDLSLFFGTYTLFLVQTHFTAKTGKLVDGFRSDYRRPGYREIINSEYLPLIAQTIRSLLSGEFRKFELSMKSYSHFQLSHFMKMIPDDMQNHFQHGIDTDDFYLKICGSGGGGYMLAISRNRSGTEAYFKACHLDCSVVEQNEIAL